MFPHEILVKNKWCKWKRSFKYLETLAYLHESERIPTDIEASPRLEYIESEKGSTQTDLPKEAAVLAKHVSSFLTYHNLY